MTLLLRYLMGLVGIGFGGKPVPGGGSDTGLTLNKPYLVLRTGMKDGKQVALVMDGDCGDGITQDKPRTSLRTGTKDGKQVQLVADQKIEGGKLILNKPYLAVRTGMKGGKQVVLVAGKNCCLCDDVTGTGTATIASAAYSGSIPIFYSSDLRLIFGGVIANIIPDEIGDDLQPVPGWAGYLYPSVPLPCGVPSFPAFNMQIFVRRCDMKIWISCYYFTSIGSGQVEMYSICDDVDDIITCSPFSVVRRMDLFNPVAWRNPNSGSGLRFISCTGLGDDCSGAEFITLSIP